MTPIFNTNREYTMMHVWCKFGDSSSNKSVTSYCVDKVKFMDTWIDGGTDRQTDGWTDEDNDNTPLAWKTKG